MNKDQRRSRRQFCYSVVVTLDFTIARNKKLSVDFQSVFAFECDDLGA